MTNLDEPEEEILYSEGEIVVTPTWLVIGDISYTIRNVQTLTLVNKPSPAANARPVFFIALLLTLWQLYRLVSSEQHFAVNWVLLVLCIILLLTTSYYAYVVPPRFGLDIDLAIRPTPLHIECPTKREKTKLYNAIHRAMDYHRGDAQYGFSDRGDGVNAGVDSQRDTAQNAMKSRVATNKVSR